MVADFAGSAFGNEFREHGAGDLGEREVDDVGIAEEVIEERLDGIEAIRPAKLEEDDPDFSTTHCECFRMRHPSAVRQ